MGVGWAVADNTLKIIDFGIAAHFEVLEMSTMGQRVPLTNVYVCGTTHGMKIVFNLGILGNYNL